MNVIRECDKCGNKDNIDAVSGLCPDCFRKSCKEEHKGICDNTDCRSPQKKKQLYLVYMKKEFEGGNAEWCKSCIERDVEFIDILKTIKELNKFKAGYYILNEYFDSIPDDDKLNVDSELKSIGL